MHRTVVADAGGLLVVAGLLEGLTHEAEEIVALDATSLLVAEYLVLRHSGRPARADVDYGLACAAVAEWFPVRSLALEAAMAAEDDIDGVAALALAHSLQVPLVTKNRELTSRQVPVLYC
jgi:hypothetical protein